MKIRKFWELKIVGAAIDAITIIGGYNRIETGTRDKIKLKLGVINIGKFFEKVERSTIGQFQNESEMKCVHTGNG